MSPERYLHLRDLHNSGVIGFAAESVNQGRLLLSLHELRRVMAGAFGGRNAAGQPASVFSLMPELRRFFDPDYVDESKPKKANKLFDVLPE